MKSLKMALLAGAAILAMAAPAAANGLKLDVDDLSDALQDALPRSIVDKGKVEIDDLASFLFDNGGAEGLDDDELDALAARIAKLEAAAGRAGQDAGTAIQADIVIEQINLAKIDGTLDVTVETAAEAGATAATAAAIANSATVSDVAERTIAVVQENRADVTAGLTATVAGDFEGTAAAIGNSVTLTAAEATGAVLRQTVETEAVSASATAVAGEASSAAVTAAAIGNSATVTFGADDSVDGQQANAADITGTLTADFSGIAGETGEAAAQATAAAIGNSLSLAMDGGVGALAALQTNTGAVEAVATVTATGSDVAATAAAIGNSVSLVATQ
jgi:hypothetical protein